MKTSKVLGVYIASPVTNRYLYTGLKRLHKGLFLLDTTWVLLHWCIDGTNLLMRSLSDVKPPLWDFFLLGRVELYTLLAVWLLGKLSC